MGTCGTKDAAQGTACNDSGGSVCDGAGNCVECNTENDCPPTGDVCLVATCVFNKCAKNNAPNGTTCNDGDACTKNDKCTNGACAGTPYTCAPNQCESASSCDGNGGCSITYKGAGTACDDGQACTYADTCDGAGNCTGTTVTCPASTDCVTYTCNGTSMCTASDAPNGTDCGPICCVGGKTCMNGLCQGACCNTTQCCTE